MGELVKKEEAPSFVLDGGHTLSEILEMSKVPETIHQYVVLHVNGKEITQDQWGFFVTADTDLVDILIRPMGGDDGKAILRLVATIVIAIVAITYGGPLAANLLNLAPGVAAPTWAVYTAQAVIAVVGTLAISALIPPPSLNLPGNSYDTGESYFLTGQSNQARKGQYRYPVSGEG